MKQSLLCSHSSLLTAEHGAFPPYKDEFCCSFERCCSHFKRFHSLGVAEGNGPGTCPSGLASSLALLGCWFVHPSKEDWEGYIKFLYFLKVDFCPFPSLGQCWLQLMQQVRIFLQCNRNLFHRQEFTFPKVCSPRWWLNSRL